MRFALTTLALGGLLCAGLGSTAVLAQSQDQQAQPPMQQDGQAPMHHGHGPMGPDQQLEHLTKALNLTSDQQAQIKPILENHHQQMMQLRQDQSLSREEKMPKMKALDEDSHTKINAILDDKQKPKFEKMAERREERGEHGGPMGPQGEPGAQPQQ